MLQYWADVKAVTRQQCDYTITGLKAVFPVALATACPIGRIRNYMQRSLDHVQALIDLGRHGDFTKIPSLRKKYKSHRRSEHVRLGHRAASEVRTRGAWGSIQHSRLKSPAAVAASVAVASASAAVEPEDEPMVDLDEEEDFEPGDERAVLPSAAAACAAAMAEVVTEAAEEDAAERAAAEAAAPEPRPAPRARTLGFKQALGLTSGGSVESIFDDAY